MNTDQIQAGVGEKKSRKVVFVVSILTCTTVALLAFVGLGIVLHEFFVFDSDRTQAQREVGRLRQTAEKQEKDNIALSETLAKREALLASRQPNMEELIALTGRVAIARHDIQSTLDDLKKIRDTLAAEQGTLTAIKKENIALTERRGLLAGDLSAKMQELADAETARAALKKQIVTLRMDREAAQAASDTAIKQFATEAERLTNLTVRVEAIRKVYQETERDAESTKAALVALNLKVQAQEANLAEQTAAVGDAERRAAKLKDDLGAITKDKVAAQAVADALKTAVADAAATHTNLLVKIKMDRDALAQTETERDNARAERDKTAAQLVLALETVRARNAEKAELEADVADLTKRRQTLETERADLEKRKQGLEAEIAALAKRKAEAVREVMP
jgi:chromosome segregation ATPase